MFYRVELPIPYDNLFRVFEEIIHKKIIFFFVLKNLKNDICNILFRHASVKCSNRNMHNSDGFFLFNLWSPFIA